MKYSKSVFILTAVIIVIINANLPVSAETNEEKASRIEKLIKEACPLYLSGIGPDEHTEKIDRAKKELVSLGDEIIPYLIKHVEKGDIQVSPVFSAMIPKGTPELVELLKTHAEPAVRARAASIMGNLRQRKTMDTVDPLILPALTEALYKDKDASVRLEAFLGLSNRSKVDKDILFHALKDENDDVQKAAIYAFPNSLEKEEAIEILHELSKSKNVEIREATGFVFYEYRDFAAIPILIEALSSEREYICGLAENRLEKWFSLRFYGKAPGQTTDHSKIPKMWEKWWQENKDTIDKQYTIIIRPEDTFSGLAYTHYHGFDPKWTQEKRRKAIMSANPGIEPTKLIDGHKLIIPRLENLDPEDY